MEQDRLAELKQKYTADHPKVIAQERVVAQLEQNKPGEDEQPTSTLKEDADNPAYVLLDTQLKSTQVEIQVLRDNKVELEKKLKRYEESILKAPMVEKQYTAMLRDYENASAKYKEMKAKQLSAELGRSLEKERKGERFTLIDPAMLPEEPESPNRPAIIFLGLVFAIGVGAGTALVMEALSPAIRGREALAAITGMPPLVVVPYLETEQESSRDHSNKIKLIALIVVGAIIAIIAFHFLIKPLDVTWYILMRKLGLS